MPDGCDMKILFVEGTETVLPDGTSEIGRQFNIETAQGADHALELICRSGPFAVVVSVMNTGTISGIDFLRKVRENDSRSVCVILADTDNLDAVVAAANEGVVFRFLTRPCPPKVLARTLTECLRQYIWQGKTLEDALQKSQAGYRRMIANLPGLVFQFSLRPDGSIKFLFLSDGCKELFNLEPDCIKEDSGALMNRFNASDRADFYQLIAESAATARPCHWQGCGWFNDEERWFHVACRPQRLSNDEVVWDGLMTDITDFKRLELENEQLARFPVENPNPVMRANAAGLVVYANKAGIDLLNGWSRKVGEALPDELFDPVMRLKGSGNCECMEARCRDRVYSIVLASVEDTDYVNLYARDITEARDAENQLIRANEILREHDRLKSEFVSTVSHELRTPLCIFKNIISNAMAGVMGKISRKLYESLQMADQSVDRLSRIISDFLDISRIEANCLELNLRSLDVATVVDDVVGALQTLARAKGITIDIDLCGDARMVKADPDRLAQILTNLIGNAIKFIPANGHITVKTTNCRDHIQFTVEDDGPGLTEQQRELIFDRFVQIHLISGPGEHGTGLGLTITKELVEMHGGRIWVESTLGQGCRFHFTLPGEPALPGEDTGKSQSPGHQHVLIGQ